MSWCVKWSPSRWAKREIPSVIEWASARAFLPGAHPWLCVSFGNWPVKSMVSIHRDPSMVKVTYNSNAWMFISLLRDTDVMFPGRSSSISINTRSIEFADLPTVNSIIPNWWSTVKLVRVTISPRDSLPKVIDSVDEHVTWPRALCRSSHPVRFDGCSPQGGRRMWSRSRLSIRA